MGERLSTFGLALRNVPGPCSSVNRLTFGQRSAEYRTFEHKLAADLHKRQLDPLEFWWYKNSQQLGTVEAIEATAPFWSWIAAQSGDFANDSCSELPGLGWSHPLASVKIE